MRKLSFILLMVIAAMTASAQSLVGNWKADINDNEVQNGCMFMDFSKNNMLKITFDMTMSSPEVGSIRFALSIKGPYSLDENKISFKAYKSSVDFQILERHFTPDLQAALSMDPSIGITLFLWISREMRKVILDEKEGLGSVFNDVENMTIIELTDKTLKVQSGLETYNMQRQ